MALTLSSSIVNFPSTKPFNPILKFNNLNAGNRKLNLVNNCFSSESPSFDKSLAAKNCELEVGSPIIVVEAPKMIKTAASVPCLRVNNGLVNPGDVGRVVSRKPKDVWAIRLAIGTYLIDGKYFKALVLDQ